MQVTSTQEWSAKIGIWQASGMSIAEWCRKNSESYHRFLYWRKRLTVPEQGTFLELTLPGVPISLECHDVLIHVPKGFDPGLLADILSVLKRG